MVKKKRPVDAVTPIAANESNGRWPPEVNAVLTMVDRLLQEGQSEKALDVLGRARITSPWITNAVAVCLLREGEAKRAADVLRSLVLASNGVTLRPDVPTVFKTNFAAALLAANRIDGCLSILCELNDEGNPAVQQLRAALQKWRRTLTLWQRIRWYLGDDPTHPFVVDFPLGRLK